MIIAYIGPDSLLPMTSVLAATLGFAAMFGRHVVKIATNGFRLLITIPVVVSRGSSGRSNSIEPGSLRRDARQGGWRGPVGNPSRTLNDVKNVEGEWPSRG